MAEEVGQAFVSILPSLKGFSTRLKTELAGELRGIDPVVGAAGHRAGGTFGDRMREGIRTRLASIGALLKTGLTAGVAAVAAGLGALTFFGLKSAASLEQTTIGIEALLGSAEDAKAFIGELQQFAAKTPFEFQGVADASRRILAFGNAVGITRDEVLPTLGVIGDLVSVLGGGEQEIASVVRALGQISSKGKVSQEELLQLAEALPGFNANAAIASALGLSVADSMEAITKGEVDATTGINALLKGMAEFPGAAGAMQKQSETLLGVFATFKDTIGIALTNAFQPVIPQIKDALATLTPILGQAIDALAPALGTGLAALLPTIGHLVNGLVPIINPIIDFFRQLTVNVDGVIGPLGEAIGSLLQAFVPLAPILGDVIAVLILSLVPVIEELAPLLVDLVEPLGDLLLALVPIIPPLAELIRLTIQAAGPLIELLGIIVSFLANEAILPLFEKLAEWMSAGAEHSAGIIEMVDSLEELGAVLSAIGDVIGEGIGNVITWFQELPGKIGEFLRELPGVLREKAKTGLNEMAFTIGENIGKVTRFFIELPGKIGDFLRELPGKLKERATEAGTSFRDELVAKFNLALDWIKSLPGKIVDFIKELPGKFRERFGEIKDQVVQLGKDIVQGVIDGIKNSVTGIGSALKDGFDSALAGVKSGLGISSPSKVYMEVGEDTVAGYIAGVEQSARAASMATQSALAPAAAATAAVAPAPPSPVPVVAGDALIAAAIDAIREAVRSQYDNDPSLAFAVT